MKIVCGLKCDTCPVLKWEKWSFVEVLKFLNLLKFWSYNTRQALHHWSCMLKSHQYAYLWPTEFLVSITPEGTSMTKWVVCINHTNGHAFDQWGCVLKSHQWTHLWPMELHTEITSVGTPLTSGVIGWHHMNGYTYDQRGCILKSNQWARLWMGRSHQPTFSQVFGDEQWFSVRLLWFLQCFPTRQPVSGHPQVTTELGLDLNSQQKPSGPRNTRQPPILLCLSTGCRIVSRFYRILKETYISQLLRHRSVLRWQKIRHSLVENTRTSTDIAIIHFLEWLPRKSVWLDSNSGRSH